MSTGTGSSPALDRGDRERRNLPTQRRGGPAPVPAGGPVGSLVEAEHVRDHATARLRDAEHWRRLVEARLDLAVAAVADIDDLDGLDHQAHPRAEGHAELEATLVRLRALIGMPDSDGRLAESTLLIQLRRALFDLDHYIREVKREVDEATSAVAAWVVDDTCTCPSGACGPVVVGREESHRQEP